jgi:outer membrane protein OmpA-like peptidoglycan-associated protein
MGKKIIKLTESELYNIVKRVLREQEEEQDNSYYNVAGMGFKIVNNQLYTASVDEDGYPTLLSNLNGVLSDFKISLDLSSGEPEGEPIDSKFVENVDLATTYWQNIINYDAAPIAYKNIKYKLFGIVPKSSKFKANQIGTPMVFGANISVLDKNYFKEFGSNSQYKESEDGTISAYTYIRKNGKSYILSFVPGQYTTSFISGKPEETPVETPTETPFELNIESPFEFDKVSLTPDAKQEFDKFIQSIKTNYANATGDVQVTCSASIDGDPEGKVASGQKRKDYDMTLSKKRAEAIVSTLKNSLPEIKLNFIANGIGETDQFAPLKKWPEVRDINQTAPNRRLIIKLPQIMKQQ